MGKKSSKRGKKASHQESDEKRRSTSLRSSADSEVPLHEVAAARPPPKVLNPFYIESSAMEEEEEEHVGLLEYSNNMADWNDDDGMEYDINPYTKPYRHRQAYQQQQQRNQVYFEWKIRIGILLAIMILVTWIILSLAHQNSPRSPSTKIPTMPPVRKTDPPTIAPVRVVTITPTSLSLTPTLSPEEHHHFSSGDTKRPVPSATPTVTFVNNTDDSGNGNASMDDGPFNKTNG